MKRIISFVLAAAFISIGFSLTAQDARKGGKKSETDKKIAVVQAYLGNSEYQGGSISKEQFDNYLRRGVKAKDAAGNSYTVEGFTFSYAERNLYEDSVGNLMILTDYLSEFCPGDTITPAIANNIFYKTKAGDTAYFDNIKVALPDGRRIVVKPMKFMLTK